MLVPIAPAGQDARSWRGFLRSFLFEVAPTDPVTLGGAAALLVCLALAALWIPARRAARVPDRGMRRE